MLFGHVYILLLNLVYISKAVHHNGQYKIIESQDGLANRLRLLAGYMYVKEMHTNFSHIIMVWDLNEACPGHFLELFHPIRGVSFISRHDLPVFAPQAMAVHPPSYQNFLEVLRRHNLWSPSDKPDIWRQARRSMYARYRALPHISQEVAQFVTKHSICSNAAIHVRHTDLDKSLNPTARPEELQRLRHDLDMSFYHFIDSLPPSMTVFLMTDSVDTQRRYLDKYGTRMVVFSIMDGDNGYVDVQENWRARRVLPDRSRGGEGGEFSTTSISSRILLPTRPSAHSAAQTHHRQSTLRRSLLDVLIGAHSVIFKGTDGSTFSELVHLFNVTSALVDVPCDT